MTKICSVCGNDQGKYLAIKGGVQKSFCIEHVKEADLVTIMDNPHFWGSAYEEFEFECKKT